MVQLSAICDINIKLFSTFKCMWLMRNTPQRSCTCPLNMVRYFILSSVYTSLIRSISFLTGILSCSCNSLASSNNVSILQITIWCRCSCSACDKHIFTINIITNIIQFYKHSETCQGFLSSL